MFLAGWRRFATMLIGKPFFASDFHRTLLFALMSELLRGFRSSSQG